MYQALYRKYRPKTFEEVAGQKVIIKTLSNSILNDKISHAYLFTGPRGTGKTSIAKIFAKIVNCESLENLTPCNKCVNCTQTINNQNTDIIEIDAASNNGVDEIRELRDKVNLVPSFGKYKVYIIDEVHMLTTAAFNALLKTLEEPPKHIIFILATTEPHKIPQTILSRCQRFDFKKIGLSEITEKLKYICKKEKIAINEDALSLIAKYSDGGMRDSISLLDQLTSYTSDKITIEDVNEVYGTITDEELFNLITEIYSKNLKTTFELLDKYDESGKNVIKIINDVINYLKNVLIYSNCSDYFEDKETKEKYLKILELAKEDNIYKTIEILLDSLKNSKLTSDSKLITELAIIKIMGLDKTIEDVEESIEVYETKKKIEVTKEYKVEKLDTTSNAKLQDLIQIRTNNALALFNKKEFIEFKKEIYKVEELLMDPDYSSSASLILDGELKVKGKNNLIFVYKTDNLKDCFNQSLLDIEKVLEKAYDEKLKPIALTTDEWEPIKIEFNKNLKMNKQTYEFKDEGNLINELNKKEEKKSSNKNKIEEEFEDLIVYN